jgi:hypothetical protein
MTNIPTGERGQQVEAILNGTLTTVDIGRVGVALVHEGVMPDITVLPDEYDLRDRERSQYDFGGHIPVGEDLNRFSRGMGNYLHLG